MLRVSKLCSLIQITYKKICFKPVIYENKPFSTKLKLFYVKVGYFFVKNYVITHVNSHPCTETDVKSSKFSFLDPNNL